MIKTADGGETWTSLNLDMSQVTAFHFLNESTGFIFNFNKELWKTTDGGKNWTLVSDKISTGYPHIYFVNESKIILSTDKQVYHTVDGGINWISDYTISTDGPLSNMKFVDSRTGYILGNNGYLARITLQ